MIKIMKRSELQGAGKFGSCSSCGCGTDEKEVYKMEFEDCHNNRSSVSLCNECLTKLKNMIV